ncbi:MAG: UDP-N-acetylmuramate dehydrogenase [Patescibacteria group bacterium]
MKITHTQLKEILGDNLKENEPLAHYTTFKIGGPADLFYEAKTKEELIRVVTAARKMKIPLFVLGGGSNVLIGDRGFRGLAVKNSTSQIIIRAIRGRLQQGKTRGLVYVEADSGVVFNKLVRFTIEEGLGGLEMHLGLPGTVGGAIYMNSKWTQPPAYVGDVVSQATLIDNDGKLKTVPATYFGFGYDTSRIQDTGEIVVSVIFALKPMPKTKLWETAEASIAYRRQTQPQGIFSPGCTFRNLTPGEALRVSTPNLTTSAGFLLDRSGLKGVSAGGAQISPVHANFIINKGGATAADVLKLIELARERVKQKYKVELKEEIVKIGDF